MILAEGNRDATGGYVPRPDAGTLEKRLIILPGWGESNPGRVRTVTVHGH